MPPITLVRPGPPPVSLVASAPGSVSGDDRWESTLGFDIAPDACSGGWVENGCDVSARSVPDRPARFRVQPFDVVVGDICSTFGFADADYQARARRLLERCESRLIARELWSGALAAAEGWTTNQHLATTDSDTITNGPTAVIDVLACLEQALGDCGCGTGGMIHATKQLVTHWVALNLVRRVDDRLETIHGTIVVSDGGYPGTGPAGETDQVWAYATGLVTVLRGPVTLTPDSLTGVWSNVNDLEFFASRPAAYAWDDCCHFAAEADLTPCLIAGAS